MARLDLEAKEFEQLTTAIKNFPGDAEKAINEVLHNDASQLLQDSIKNLIPVSGRQWKGKRAPASAAKSLTDKKENLAITVKTTKNYHYLYFPDDGSNTKNHRGNQQFFHRGGESQKSEIIGRCIARLVENMENN